MKLNINSVCLLFTVPAHIDFKILSCEKQGSSDFQCREKMKADTLLEEDIKVSQGVWAIPLIRTQEPSSTETAQPERWSQPGQKYVPFVFKCTLWAPPVFGVAHLQTDATLGNSRRAMCANVSMSCIVKATSYVEEYSLAFCIRAFAVIYCFTS